LFIAEFDLVALIALRKSLEIVELSSQAKIFVIEPLTFGGLEVQILLQLFRKGSDLLGTGVRLRRFLR